MPDAAPLWVPGLSEARITSDGPLETGSTLVYRGTFLGRYYESSVLCTGLTQNKQYAYGAAGTGRVLPPR